MERFRNYGLWVAIAAFIPLVLSAFGINIIPNYQNIVNALLSILVMAGILNNPTTTNKWFGDDKPADTTTGSNTTNDTTQK